MNRIAVFAHFDSNCEIKDYVIYYLKELKKVVDKIIFVSDCDVDEPYLKLIEDYVYHSIAKRHGEYDFGSYKRGYFYALENNLLDDCDELILANDSCYGPLFPLQEMFDKMKTKDADFWGCTANKYGISYLFTGEKIKIEYPHLQSYFMTFNKNVFMSEIFKNFMADIKRDEIKDNIIIRYEMNFTKILVEGGFKADSYCKYYSNINFMVMKHKELIVEDRCPFIKKSLDKYLDISDVGRFLIKNSQYDKKLIKKYFPYKMNIFEKIFNK